MKQKFLFIGSFMLMVAAAGAYHAYTSNSAVKDGDLLMANVEALANRAESSGGNTVDCYSSVRLTKVRLITIVEIVQNNSIQKARGIQELV